jgi:hypothetical protein
MRNEIYFMVFSLISVKIENGDHHSVGATRTIKWKSGEVRYSRFINLFP